jgi:hypothetical protein
MVFTGIMKENGAFVKKLAGGLYMNTPILYVRYVGQKADQRVEKNQLGLRQLSRRSISPCALKAQLHDVCHRYEVQTNETKLLKYARCI